MAEGDQAQGHAPQARDLQQGRPPLGPAPVADHPVLLDQPAMGGEDQGHRVVGDLLDESVGTIGDRNAFYRCRLDIDRVDADAAQGDDFAALQPVDHLFGNASPLGVERIGLARSGEELVLGSGRDLEDFGVDWRERLHLVAVAAAGDGKAGSCRRRDPELGQNSLPCARLMPGSHRRRRGLSIAAHSISLCASVS